MRERGEGIERVAFTAIDSAAGAEEIRARGYAALGPTDFERPVTMPDGTRVGGQIQDISMADRGGAGGNSHFRMPAQDAGDGVDSAIAATRQRRQASQARACRLPRAGKGRSPYGAHDRPRSQDRAGWRGGGALRFEPRRFCFPDEGSIGPADIPTSRWRDLPERGGAGLVLATSDPAAAEKAVGKAGVRIGGSVVVAPADANGALLAFVPA